MTEQLSGWGKIRKRFNDTIDKQIRKDKPYKVGLGCALGLGVNFFPTMGFGFAFAFLLAVIFKVNRAAATATSLITGPLIPLMYALNLLVGGLVLTPVAGQENLREFITHQYLVILSRGGFQEKFFGFLEFFGSTFILGAAVNAAVFCTGFYLLVRRTMNKKLNKQLK